jgi:hypothetical protein
MADYQRCATIKLATPGTPEGYMIINASDYRADQPQWMYDQGLAYDPAVWKPYVEQPVKAPADVKAEDEPAHTMAASRSTSHAAAAAEKK